ncbi:hypothetical protein BDW02DRAFT_470284, partial [Decorospora gaudefroyi]
PTPTTTAIPEAPLAIIPNASPNDGFSPAALIGIIIAVVVLVLCVPLIAILLRRYEKTRVRETPNSPASSQSSIREDHSLRSILVTKELSRSSLRMDLERVDSGVRRPEEVYANGMGRDRGWSRTEVRGG